MKRTLTAAVILAGLLVVVAARADETVEYLDRTTGKTASFSGTVISDTPTGVRVKQATMSKDIPFGDIQHIVFFSGEVRKAEYSLPFTKIKTATEPGAKPEDRARLLKEARGHLEGVLEKLGRDPTAKRYLQFRIAECAALLARDDPTQRDEAVKLLTRFKLDNPSCWELVPAVKLLAQQHEASGNLDAARGAYEELANNDRVPKEIKEESQLLVGQLYLRGGKFAEAEKSLGPVSTALPEADPRKPRALIYLTQAQVGQGNTANAEKQLTAAVANTDDALLKGLAHNALGDLYRQKKQDAEAFWHYLRVDVMYHQDREEHAKALYYLSKLYESARKDQTRAQLAAERLKEKQFDGTEYQRRINGEK